jgi:integrase
LREDDHRIPHFEDPRHQWPENERRKMDSYIRFESYLDEINAERAKKALPEIRHITDLDKDIIDDFILNHRALDPRTREMRTMSLSTRNKAASAFSTLMRWSTKQKLVPANQYLDRTETPLPESDPIFLEDEEFEYLLELLEEIYAEGDREIKIKAAAIMIFAFTGSRNTETLNLKWRDDGEKFTNFVDLQNMRFIYQDHKTRKANRSAISTAMSASAKALLIRLKEDVGTHGKYIFYSHRSIEGAISRKTSNKFFTERLRPALIERFGWLKPAAGYDEPNPIGVLKANHLTQYNLRHTFATLSLASGDFTTFEVQTQLKHKDPKVTQKYLGVSQKMLTGLSKKMR